MNKGDKIRERTRKIIIDPNIRVDNLLPFILFLRHRAP